MNLMKIKILDLFWPPRLRSNQKKGFQTPDGKNFDLTSKQRLRQKEIRSGRDAKPLAEWACNSNMVTISLGFWKSNTGIFLYIVRNATDASASRNSGPFVTSVSRYRGFQCVGTAGKSNACLKRETVLSSMAVFSLLAWGWW